MLRPAPVPGSHDELFLARYQRLMRWALRLTEGKQHAAEDLVHDAFIQFTLKQPDLAAIQNLDDYLFVMLRNLHISQARRASQSPTIRLAISDYDTARMGLRLIDPQRQLQARDDLRRVCEYVIQRKETSKAASVLILRFFHSYFPSEIASILRTTRQAVEIWLLNARRESRLYLEDPSALKLIAEKGKHEKVVRLPQRMSNQSSDIFRQLSEIIFASHQGECFTKDQLRELYASEETIESKPLAHIVSCSNCLEAVNDLLGLSSLNERQQMDSSDTDKTPPDDGGPTATSSGNGGLGELGKHLRRRRRETIEHRPKELRIAVNGFFVSRQKVGMPVNELALKLNLEEKISFIEVFSEQGLLLSHFTVTPPTDGEIEQREQVEFSEGRALETAVSFETQWPTLKVVYRDPLVADLLESSGKLQFAESSSVELQTGESVVSPLSPRYDTDLQTVAPEQPFWGKRLGGIFGTFSTRSGEAYRTLQFWLRPGVITAAFALFLLATVWFVIRRPSPTTPVTAVDVLLRATNAENVAAANTSTTTHRTLEIEERRGSLAGEVVARQRVEVWQSAAKGVTARRLYDDHGRLLAGEWSRTDNVATLYHHAAKPQLEIANPQSALRTSDIWRLAPSAKDFIALIGSAQHARIEEQANHYVLTFDGNGQKIGHASLILNRDDLHAVEQTLLIQQEHGTRAYRIVETSFERRPNDAVAPAVFEPEPELLSSVEPETRNPKFEAHLPAPGPQPLTPVLATPALEVEVLQLLNQANAFMGEQVSVTRTSEGRLLVSGLVESDQRKAELLNALVSVRTNPAVRVQIETVAEAAQRERPKSSDTVTVERVETTEGTSPAYADLKKKFSDDEARRYADRVMARSRQARRHALAIKQLAERFSLNDLRALPEADRARWIGLLQQHAREFRSEIESLQRELQIVFPALTGSALAATNIGSDAEIQESARRLYELSVVVDEAVRQSFTLSTQNPTPAQVKTQHFWQSLKSAESLAARIAAAR